MYTALVLPSSERKRLRQRVAQNIPEGWRIFCHHVTLNMGPITKGKNIKSLLGHEIDFTVDAFGINDKVCAVRVSHIANGVCSMNKVPHVTVAVDQVNGGKPVMSNDLQMWVPIRNEIFSGIVTEVG